MNEVEKNTPKNPEYDTEPDNTSLDDIFGMRRNALKRKLQLLKDQIHETQESLEVNLEAIDLDLCACGSIASSLPYGESQNLILLKYKFPLYEEKRKRRTECLRDTAMLRRELLDTTLQYLSLEDKEELLK